MSLRASLPVAFIDTETSALHPGGTGRLLEIAVAKWHSAGYLAYESLIRADDAAYSWKAMSVNHLRATDTIAYPDRAAVLAEVRDLLRTYGIRHLVAHRAQFDRGWLPELREYRWLCSMNLARRAWPHAESHANFALFHGLNLPQTYTQGRPSHRALTDILATSEVFFAALEQLGLDRTATIDDVVRVHDAPFEPPVLWYGWDEIRGLPLRRVSNYALQWLIGRAKDIDDDTRDAAIRILQERGVLGPRAHKAS